MCSCLFPPGVSAAARGLCVWSSWSVCHHRRRTPLPLPCLWLMAVQSNLCVSELPISPWAHSEWFWRIETAFSKDLQAPLCLFVCLFVLLITVWQASHLVSHVSSAAAPVKIWFYVSPYLEQSWENKNLIQALLIWDLQRDPGAWRLSRPCASFITETGLFQLH